MKPQTQFLIIVSLLILVLGGAYYVYSSQTHPTLPVFPATVRRDCAPWDGAAFTVSIPIEEGVIDITLYRSPELHFAEKFSFPDSAGRIGNALLLGPVGIPDELSGEVLFQSVSQESPVEGTFDLRTQSDRQFKGRFSAAWDDQAALCG
jgi:hypothetical protein